MTDQTTDLPQLLADTLTQRYTELGNPGARMDIHFKGPDGWPASRPVSPNDVAAVLRELLTAGVRDAARQASGQQPDTEADRYDARLTQHMTPAAAGELRRRLDTDTAARRPVAVGVQDATQPTTEAHPPVVGFAVEVEGEAGWTQVTATFDTPTAAAQRQGRIKKQYPGLPTRIIRETVTRTVEPDAAGAES